MIVRCANCHTEFSLDDQQIGPEGATVRCSVCSYVFPVDPPPGAGEHPWQIRTVEDLLFTAPDLATLRTWIAEGRLHPDDQVSRTGKHWLRLGDMPEFSSSFSGYGDLPPVFEALELPAGGSALDELPPPPGFGQTMPVVQGVDTDILVVRPDAHGDFEVPVTARSAAVERSGPHGRAMPSSVPAPAPAPVAAALGSETSGPEPFPLAELPVHDDDDDDRPPARPAIDDSALRMRPRPPAPARPVPAIPEAVGDDPIEEVRRRPARPTVRYGAEEVHGSASMLDAVTSAVDDEDDDAADHADVRPTAAAVERPGRREASGQRRAAVAPRAHGRSGARAAAPEPVARHKLAPRSEPDPEALEQEVARPRRRHRTFAREIGKAPQRSPWPLVAGLGLLAGVALVFGVPSIRAKVMGLAGELTEGEPPFDLGSLPELAQARAAIATLDPIAVGQAEAALQGRLDEGTVPPAGVAEMKLAQVELLATRAIERAIGLAAGVPADEALADDDVERATQILTGLDADVVVDRAHMRRVRALLRLSQGRPPGEIVPLLPEDGSGELRQLVQAAPLWREPTDPVPAGVIDGLAGLPDKSALAELALALGYLRAGDETRALQLAEGVLARVPAQPTALAVKAKASAASPTSPEPPADDGKAPPPGDDAGTPAPAEGKPSEDSPEDPEPDEPKPAKTESVDSLIERGCRLVESGDASDGLELLRKAKARRSKDLDLLVCMGQGHAKQGRHRDALSSYDAALAISPRFAAALAGAARACDKLGDTKRAVDLYRRLLSVRPGDPKALAYVQEHG